MRFIYLLCFSLNSLVLSAQHRGILKPDGGGENKLQATEHISEEQRQSIISMLRDNVRQLELQGVDMRPSQPSQVALQWPLKRGNGFNDSGYCAISNYVDQYDQGVLDYNCGLRTYNGHKGTDIYLWPFAWSKMFTSSVEIVAAAPGIIIGKTDNFSDLSCSMCTNCTWNAIYIQHGDGSIAWYGHLKTNSITAKSIGQTVDVGEYLGVVGSSGNSTGPHLHFEVYKNNSYTELIDPYAGGCNMLNGANSWWSTQENYRVPTLNTVMTHDTFPMPYGCYNVEIMNARAQFRLGEKVYLGSYYRDDIYGLVSNHKLIKPDGSLHYSWDSNNGVNYSSSWWIYIQEIPAVSSSIGNWKYEVTYNGKTVKTSFTVMDFATSIPNIEGLDKFYIAPNPTINDVRVHLELSSRKKVSLVMIDMTGRELYKMSPKEMNGSNILPVDLKKYATGSYFLHIQIGNEKISHKVIKNK